MSLANSILENIQNHNDEKEFSYMSVRMKPEMYHMLELIAKLNSGSIGSVITKEVYEYIVDMFLLYVSTFDKQGEEDELNSFINDMKSRCPAFYQHVLLSYMNQEYRRDSFVKKLNEVKQK